MRRLHTVSSHCASEIGNVAHNTWHAGQKPCHWEHSAMITIPHFPSILQNRQNGAHKGNPSQNRSLSLSIAKGLPHCWFSIGKSWCSHCSFHGMISFHFPFPWILSSPGFILLLPAAGTSSANLGARSWTRAFEFFGEKVMKQQGSTKQQKSCLFIQQKWQRNQPKWPFLSHHSQKRVATREKRIFCWNGKQFSIKLDIKWVEKRP